MATVSITIPDALIPRLTAAMRASFPQYGPTGTNLTDVQCFKKVTADYWSSILSNYESRQAELQQAQQSITDAAGIG